MPEKTYGVLEKRQKQLRDRADVETEVRREPEVLVVVNICCDVARAQKMWAGAGFCTKIVDAARRLKVSCHGTDGHRADHREGER